VNAYLKSGIKLPIGQFDPTKRAFPDVAANAHNYLVNMKTMGGFFQVDGYVKLMKHSKRVVDLVFLLQHFCLHSSVWRNDFASEQLLAEQRQDLDWFRQPLVVQDVRC
jgi:hypothetical protein